MSLACQNKTAHLLDRAHMLSACRAFFEKRKLVEVDCPMATSAASVDLHIDLFQMTGKSGVRYLHTSPEYAMKRLLAQGMGDIYQLGHVFRDEEHGIRHNPEFMMAEWYRTSFTFEAMIEETADFVRLFLGNQPLKTLTYRQALLNYAGIDYVTADENAICACLEKHGHPPSQTFIDDGKDALLNLLLALVVEPHFEKEGLLALTEYPSSQAALARTRMQDGALVAERFELYCGGLELANGYHELTDPQEQKIRFETANRQREQAGKPSLPIDAHFLDALNHGLPDCCGVAVGFDRLMMLRSATANIRDVLPFAWEEI